MDYFDPHIHMVSRTTDDYETLAKMGCVAMSEPAFWAGFDRGSVRRFSRLLPAAHASSSRSGRAGTTCSTYTWLCINAKEAENVRLSREVIAMIPEFLDQPGVLGIGEIGLNKNTRNESIVFLEHLELAEQLDEQILIHTPHLEDKYQGTRMILDMLARLRRARPQPRAGRSRRGAHDPAGARAGLLGRHDALSGEQVHAGAGGATWSRCTAPERLLVNSRRRLGTVEADGRARLHPGDAAARAPGGADPQGRVREPAGVLQPEPEFSVHSAGRRAVVEHDRRRGAWRLEGSGRCAAEAAISRRALGKICTSRSTDFLSTRR